MRTLIVALLLISAPAAWAGQVPIHSSDTNRRPPAAWQQRGIEGPARQLDRAATDLYRDIRSRAGRSELSSRARNLAEAAHDFRRLAERDAPPVQLRAAYRQVSQHYALLEQRFDRNDRQWRYRQAFSALLDVGRAVDQAGAALQRYARNDRDWRRDRRWHDDGDRYAFNPRDPWQDRDRRDHRDD
jgi:hypothetical protein